MNKAAGVEFSLETLIKIVLSAIIFFVIVLFPVKLYGYFTGGNEKIQKENMANLGTEISEMVSVISAKEAGEEGMTIPIHVFAEFAVMGYSLNSPSCVKGSSCICAVSKHNPDKRIACHNFKDIRVLPVGEIFSGNEDGTMNVRILAKKKASEITVEIQFIENKRSEDQDGRETDGGSCPDIQPQGRERAVKQVFEKYGSQVDSASLKYGLDRNLLAGIMSTESNADPYAISPCGAAGLMQLMPHTADELGVKPVYRLDYYLELHKRNKAEKKEMPSCIQEYADSLSEAKKGRSPDELKAIDGRFDVGQNIDAAANYLKSLIKKYERNGEEKYKLAIAAYNSGPWRIDTYCCRDGECRFDDTCCISLYKETREYVPKVLAYAETAKAIG